MERMVAKFYFNSSSRASISSSIPPEAGEHNIDLSA
jgi:hypothetical protein